MRYIVLVVLAAAATLAYAQGGAFGRYYVVADAQGGVWRLDAANGDLVKCRGSDTIQCVRAH